MPTTIAGFVALVAVFPLNPGSVSVICQIIEFQHVKPGKGAAFVRTKLKDIKSGGVVVAVFPLNPGSVSVIWSSTVIGGSIAKISPLQEQIFHILTEKICSIYITMEIFITLWMVRHMTR